MKKLSPEVWKIATTSPMPPKRDRPKIPLTHLSEFLRTGKLGISPPRSQN